MKPNGPLHVDWIRQLGPAGRLGLTVCPGRKGPSFDHRRMYARNTVKDVNRLRRLGATLVVSLLEPHEYVTLGVTGLPAALTRAGIAHVSLPVPDGGLPRDRTAWDAAVLHTLAAAARGHAVVHCRAGLGRSGTFVGCCLRALHYSGQETLALLEGARGPRCPETTEQEAFVLAY